MHCISHLRLDTASFDSPADKTRSFSITKLSHQNPGTNNHSLLSYRRLKVLLYLAVTPWARSIKISCRLSTWTRKLSLLSSLLCQERFATKSTTTTWPSTHGTYLLQSVQNCSSSKWTSRDGVDHFQPCSAPARRCTPKPGPSPPCTPLSKSFGQIIAPVSAWLRTRNSTGSGSLSSRKLHNFSCCTFLLSVISEEPLMKVNSQPHLLLVSDSNC